MCSALRMLISTTGALRKCPLSGATLGADAAQGDRPCLTRARRGAAAGEGEDADEDEEDGADASDGTLVLRAAAKLAGGVALCAVFSNPLVGALGRLSDATGVPPFFVGCAAQTG